jgi:protoheme ferro-lyase
MRSKGISQDLQLKGYSVISNFLDSKLYNNLKKEVFSLKHTMEEEPSTETDKEGNTIILDTNPILARKIQKNDKYSNNCQQYIENLSQEISKILNQSISELKLKPSTDELDFNKIACCYGKNIQLPKHFDNGGKEIN